MKEACLYIGTVFHKRYVPKVHKLKYNVFMLFSDLDNLKEISDKHRYFSLNKFNLISLYETDYGNPDTSCEGNLKQRILNILENNSIDPSKVTAVKLLTYPRVLGFVFNPISVFYCYTNNNLPYAVIYEVRNTFSERHNYIFSIPPGGAFETVHVTEKKFHVSPFFDRLGDYTFAIQEPNEKVSVVIDYKKQSAMQLKACFSGKKIMISDRVLMILSLKIPFMTFKIIFAILYEALILKLKGLKVFKHPENHVYQSSSAQVKSVGANHKINEETE